MMIIYKATNTKNNKAYIGQTIHNLNFRIKSHLSEARRDNLPFHNALLKYTDYFEWKILESCTSKEELDELESHYIKQYNTLLPNGYNLTLGGEGTHGWIPSKETKEKISKANKGKKLSQEAIEKRRKKMFGKIPWNKGLTKDDHPSLQKIAEKSRINSKNINYLPNRKGCKLTDGHKEKIRKSKFGKRNGWHLSNITDKQLEDKSKYLYEITDKNERKETIKVLSIWCRKNNIDYEKFRSYVNKNKFYCGYKSKRIS